MGQRPKMSRAERAKQFMPFAALKGYSEALRRKEKKIVPQIVLSEAQEEEGLIEKPHTSAGRVPSAKGYRYRHLL